MPAMLVAYNSTVEFSRFIRNVLARLVIRSIIVPAAFLRISAPIYTLISFVCVSSATSAPISSATSATIHSATSATIYSATSTTIYSATSATISTSIFTPIFTPIFSTCCTSIFSSFDWFSGYVNKITRN